jgi:hypothetical protein
MKPTQKRTKSSNKGTFENQPNEWMQPIGESSGRFRLWLIPVLEQDIDNDETVMIKV